jgi:1-phosphofructokinase family hexose kinase
LILSVTLNVAIDRAVVVPNFALGRRHRSVESRTAAGGKGVNVARALSLLGRPVIATGFVGGLNGEQVIQQLQREAILTDFTRVAEETRINLAVVEPSTGEQTEINERGPSITEAEAEAFVERLDYLARGADICVLAGSLPPGLEPDFYGRLIEILKGHGVIVVLDTEGQAMSAGIKAGPSMITPNRVEAEELIGREVESHAELAEALSDLTGLGSAEAAVTLPEGCLAVVGEGAERRVLEATIDPLEPISRGGSGDAFVAGYVAALHDGRGSDECLAYGVACGAESTQHLGAGWVDRESVDRLLEEVRVQQVDISTPVA